MRRVGTGKHLWKPVIRAGLPEEVSFEQEANKEVAGDGVVKRNSKNRGKAQCIRETKRRTAVWSILCYCRVVRGKMLRGRQWEWVVVWHKITWKADFGQRQFPLVMKSNTGFGFSKTRITILASLITREMTLDV